MAQQSDHRPQNITSVNTMYRLHAIRDNT